MNISQDTQIINTLQGALEAHIHPDGTIKFVLNTIQPFGEDLHVGKAVKEVIPGGGLRTPKTYNPQNPGILHKTIRDKIKSGELPQLKEYKGWMIHERLRAFMMTLKKHYMNDEIIGLLFKANTPGFGHYNAAISNSEILDKLKARKWATFRAMVAVSTLAPVDRFYKLGRLQRHLKKHGLKIWEVPIAELSIRSKYGTARKDVELYIGLCQAYIEGGKLPRISRLMINGSNFGHKIKVHNSQQSLRERLRNLIDAKEQRERTVEAIRKLKEGDYSLSYRIQDLLQAWPIGKILRIMQPQHIIKIGMTDFMQLILGSEKNQRRFLATCNQECLLEEELKRYLTEKYPGCSAQLIYKRVPEPLKPWVINKMDQLMATRTHGEYEYRFISRIDEIVTQDLRDATGEINYTLSVERVLRNAVERRLRTQMQWLARTEVPLFKELHNVTVDGHSFYHLNNAESIVREGANMSHCVGGYVNSAMQAEVLLFHVDDGTKAGATLAYNLSNGTLQFNQVYGIYNSVVSGDTYTLVTTKVMDIVKRHIEDWLEEHKATVPVISEEVLQDAVDNQLDAWGQLPRRANDRALMGQMVEALDDQYDPFADED